MKTLLLPACILLLTVSCNKQDLPGPVSTEPTIRASNATARISNDTLARITLLPLGRGPAAAETGPVIRR